MSPLHPTESDSWRRDGHHDKQAVVGGSSTRVSRIDDPAPPGHLPWPSHCTAEDAHTLTTAVVGFVQRHQPAADASSRIVGRLFRSCRHRGIFRLWMPSGA